MFNGRWFLFRLEGMSLIKEVVYNFRINKCKYFCLESIE